MKSILILSMYGDLAASSRQRVVQYLDVLEENMYDIRVEPLFPNEYLENIFSKKKSSIIKILYWYLKRFYFVTTSSKYDLIWIQYELFPQLPSIFESLILSFNENFILDFDDAIFHKYDLWGNSVTKFFLGTKLELLCSKAKVIVCGNDYIRDWAKQFCQCTELIPTVINFDKYNSYKKEKLNESLVIGWIGSPATWLYMNPLIKVLEDLSKIYDFQVLIVGSGHDYKKLENFKFKTWKEDSEISDIYEMDIGIMPLFDDPWALGKCGYKLIQYMACGKPVIASPVGVNCNIVEDGVNGLFASSEEDWKTAIITLVSDKKLRDNMGIAGSHKVQVNFSLQSTTPALLKLIKGLIDV